MIPIMKTIDGAYEYIKQTCRTTGTLITDQRGDKLYQIPYITLKFDEKIHQRIADIHNIKIPSECNPLMLDGYVNQLQDGDIGGFIYTYGNRFIEHFGVNQYKYMISKLKEDTHSRRAVAVTLDPKLDSEREEIPCLQLIKLSVYDNKLVMGVVFRSNCIKYAFKYNMYGLLMLQQRFANELGLDCGEFIYVGFDVHYKVI